MIMGNVAIFCAASENIAPGYFEAAGEVGTMLGRMGATMVYGGARFGLMEATAKAAKAAGARVVGVVPEIRSLEVGVNVCVAGTAYDAVLVSSFDDADAMERYKVHSAHVAVAAYFKGITEGRAEADYEA